MVLRGIDRGFGESTLSAFQGLAVCAEGETDDAGWRWWREHFRAR